MAAQLVASRVVLSSTELVSLMIIDGLFTVLGITWYLSGLRDYGASLKVTNSITDQVIGFCFSIYLILPAALRPWGLLGF
jgi:hypothetical protein